MERWSSGASSAAVRDLAARDQRGGENRSDRHVRGGNRLRLAFGRLSEALQFVQFVERFARRKTIRVDRAQRCREQVGSMLRLRGRSEKWQVVEPRGQSSGRIPTCFKLGKHRASPRDNSWRKTSELGDRNPIAS